MERPILHPEEQYDYTEEPPYKFWSLDVDFLPDASGGRNYCFKVSSKTLRLDAKMALPDDGSQQLKYIAQSARTIEPSAKQDRLQH